MVKYRHQKVSSEIKRLIGTIISTEVRDPSVPAMCSVISVKVGNDLKQAKINISFMDEKADPVSAVKALNKAAGFIRHRLGELMTTRTVPELTFVYNQSIEHSIRISELLHEIENENTDKN